ncbi:MAG TPA: hypothetical protein VGL81_03305 [Polyangiaceae bacterium]
MRRYWFAIVPVLPLAGTLGCTGTVASSPLDAEAATTTSAIVVVERTSDPSQGARAEGSARFIRVAAPATVDDALRAIGAALELPARGTCASVHTLAGESAPSDVSPSVELVDVGAVSLETNGVETRLTPRQLPDVTDVVTGFVYARSPDPALLPAAAKYVVHVAGGIGVMPFDAVAMAPVDPVSIRLAGEDERAGVVVTSSALELTWTPDGSDDVVYVDIRPSGVRCVFEDGGRSSLPAALFEDDGTIVLHRLRREALGVPGTDSGEIRFDFARSVSYTRK